MDREQLLADTKAFAATESAPGIPIEAVVREGNTAAEILEQAAIMTADLLVIGTHGRSGFERLLLGSVAEKSAPKASCPVLTVPNGHRRRAVGPGPLQADSLPGGLLGRVMERAEIRDLDGEGSRRATIDDFLKQREEALRAYLRDAAAEEGVAAPSRRRWLTGSRGGRFCTPLPRRSVT